MSDQALHRCDEWDIKKDGCCGGCGARRVPSPPDPRDAQLAALREALADERAKREEAEKCCRWEEDNARLKLPEGLADEFPFGCDTIEHIGVALLAARSRALAAERQRDELVAAAREIRKVVNHLANKPHLVCRGDLLNLLDRLDALLSRPPAPSPEAGTAGKSCASCGGTGRYRVMDILTQGVIWQSCSCSPAAGDASEEGHDA